MPGPWDGFEGDRGSYFHGLLAQPNCSQCPLRNDTKVLPDGPVPAKIAFVGEAPGQLEVAQGRGFIGPSGVLLWKMAAHVGISREDVWVTNSALCAFRKVRLASGAVIPEPIVKALATAACRTRLLEELIHVGARVAVPLGNWALWSIYDRPKSKVFDFRGSVNPQDLAALLERVRTGRASVPIRQIKET